MTAQPPTFGKKVSGTPPRRAPVGAQAPLSPAAQAFLARETQGSKPPAATAPLPWASQETPSSFGSGKPVWGRRVIARLADELLVWFLLYLVFNAQLSAAVSTYIVEPEGSPAESMAAVTLFGYGLLFAFIQCVYNIAMEASSLQATLGKMMVGAVVTAKDGTKPSLGGVIMRNTLGRFVVNIIPFYIGYFIGLFKADRRCIHDMMSGTMVRQRLPGGGAAQLGEVFA